MVLSVKVNSLKKAIRISKSRNASYDVFYGFNGETIYKVYYATLEVN